MWRRSVGMLLLPSYFRLIALPEVEGGLYCDTGEWARPKFCPTAAAFFAVHDSLRADIEPLLMSLKCDM